MSESAKAGVDGARIDEGAAAAIIPLPARPRSVDETGLRLEFLAELVLKHLHVGGVLDLQQLVDRVALAGVVLESVLAALRKEGRIEIRGAQGDRAALRFALTDQGRAEALAALSRAGYVGPAPVPLDKYTQIVRQQSVHGCTVTREKLRRAFADVVISEARLDQLGPALNSGRALMIYGLAGAGKTYTCQRFARVLGDGVLIPHAIAVDDNVIQYFDPIYHRPIEDSEGPPSLHLEQGYDRRYVRCRRPVAISGGELTLDMLEIDYNPATKLSQAPIQFKANNGIYVVDDLGRQRVPTVQLLNRWIVPMEEQVDYLTLGTGKRFPVPFDVVLVFSTNLDPASLADEAFLRRIGYKVHFEPVDISEYEEIWRRCCLERGVDVDVEQTGLDFLFAMYREQDKPLLPCHPRDLIGLVVDQCLFVGEAPAFTPERLRAAWHTYFVADFQSREAR
jgi:predicted ATPase with chaperone activity